MNDHMLTDDLAEFLILAMREEIKGPGGRENPYYGDVAGIMFDYCGAKPETGALLRLGRGDFQTFDEALDFTLNPPKEYYEEEIEHPSPEEILEWLEAGLRRRKAEDAERDLPSAQTAPASAEDELDPPQKAPSEAQAIYEAKYRAACLALERGEPYASPRIESVEIDQIG